MSNPSVVGTDVPDVRAKQRVTGTAPYTIDLVRPGMLIGRVVRSPYGRAKILSIDTSKAESLPGVKAVITYKDVPEIPFPSYDLRLLAGSADPHVRFVGDEVAAIAAESEEIADKAAKLVDVSYQTLPASLSTDESMQEGGVDVESPFFTGNLLPPYNPLVLSRGDLDVGFAQADYVFEQEYRVPTQVAAPLRPFCCLAEWSGDQLTVYNDSQVIYTRQAELATFLQIPTSNVRVVSQFIGGQFGEDNLYRFIPLAAFLAKKTNRPVKMVMPQDYSFESAPNKRHSALMKVRLGALNDGTLTAVYLYTVFDKGAYFAGGASVPYVGARGIFNAYRCPNVTYEAYAVFTDNPPAGAFRGYGGVQTNFAVQSAMDDMANQMGLDPTAVHLANCIRADDVLEIEGISVDFSQVGGSAFTQAIEDGMTATGWTKTRETYAAANAAGPNIRRGLGMALLTYGFGHIPDTANVDISIGQNGEILLTMGMADLGGGQPTTMSLLAAQVLGAELADVSIQLGDTNYPAAPVQGTFGSRTTFISGNAVVAAATNAKQSLLQTASKVLGADVSALYTSGSRVYVTDSGQSASFAEILSAAGSSPISTSGQYVHSETTSKSGFQFGACFADVSVDVWTGKITTNNLWMIQDYGKVLNPLGVEGQMQGAALQGLAYGVLEDYVVDPTTSQSITRDWLYYRVPTITDVPVMTATTIENPDPRGPLGAKGGGESMIICTHSAIRNAIANAIGVRFTTIPITPQRVIEAMKGDEVP